VIKKFDLPSFQPLTKAQRENKMVDTISQAVAQAFIKGATVMGNTVHNAVVKTFAEGTFPGCMGPCYIARSDELCASRSVNGSSFVGLK